MMFSDTVLASALIRPNGECAWMKNDIPDAVHELVSKNLAILGGEAWLSDGQQVIGIIPQRTGSAVVYHWEIDSTEEPWGDFIHRCAAETSKAVKELSVLIRNEALIPDGFKVFFNLIWEDEAGFSGIHHPRSKEY